jgi:flagellar assembly protein FliH
MISPSENARGSALFGSPMRLLGGEKRGVSRLEFYPPERVVIAVEVEPEAPNDLLKEELALLDARMRSQTEEMTAKIELVRTEAKAEARLEWEKEMEDKIAQERAQVVKSCQEFFRDRARYFAGVEAEVVKLALAIAARVLHREAKLDPLLLAGVVRIALEKVAEDSTTVLRVPVSEVEMWREAFLATHESPLQIVGDERLGAGDCMINTNVGTVDLGVDTQLQEIERGFFDLLQRRPA